MRNLIVLAALGLLIINPTFAGEDPKTLYKEINRKVTLDLSKIKLLNQRKNFVMVLFKIVDKKIEIVDIGGPNENLTDIISAELEEMRITSDYDENKVYQYKFKFVTE